MRQVWGRPFGLIVGVGCGLSGWGWWSGVVYLTGILYMGYDAMYANFCSRPESGRGSADLEPGIMGEIPPAPARRGSLPVLLLRAMRPKQWSKNVLLFAGLLFALQFTHWDAIWRACVGFALFCLLSSCVYIMNDLVRSRKGRLSKRTASRPIASGALKPQIAIAFVSILLPVTFILSYWLSPWFALSGRSTWRKTSHTRSA